LKEDKFDEDRIAREPDNGYRRLCEVFGDEFGFSGDTVV